VRGIALPRYPGLQMGLPARALLTELWSRHRPDVVHVVTEGPLGWSAIRTATRLRIALTSDFRTNFDAYSSYYGMGWLKNPIGAYLRKFHNRTLITTAPTASLRRELLARGYRNVQVAARGVDTTLFNPSRRSQELRRSWGAPGDEPVIGYVGRLAPEKNVPLLLTVFREIRRLDGRARLVLVGDGPLRAELNDDPGIVRAGMRSGEDLAAHYASFDFFLFPSVTETFGNVTIEAMASGLAVVAYDYAAAGEHIIDGASGLLAEYGNTRHFSEQAQRLVADAKLAAALRIGARRAAEKIDWGCVVQSMEEVLFAAVDTPVARHGAAHPLVRSRPQRANS
jgi:glycosyltransferase involved in cell wall biosynthesis